MSQGKDLSESTKITTADVISSVVAWSEIESALNLESSELTSFQVSFTAGKLVTIKMEKFANLQEVEVITAFLKNKEIVTDNDKDELSVN